MYGLRARQTRSTSTANPRTNIMDFRGSDSSIILNLRGGIPRPVGNVLQNLTQAMLVGVIIYVCIYIYIYIYIQII